MPTLEWPLSGSEWAMFVLAGVAMFIMAGAGVGEPTQRCRVLPGRNPSQHPAGPAPCAPATRCCQLLEAPLCPPAPPAQVAACC